MSNTSGQTTQLKFDFNRSQSRNKDSQMHLSSSTSRLGNIQYGALTRPPTRDNNSRPITREKSPKGLMNINSRSNLSSAKNLNRCESSRNNLNNLTSTDNLMKYSQEELMFKSQSLHNLNTLIDEDELNIDVHNMDPSQLQKQTGDCQEKMRTILQEYKQLQDKHDTIEIQWNMARLNWKDNAEWKNMEAEVIRSRKFMQRCNKSGIII